MTVEPGAARWPRNGRPTVEHARQWLAHAEQAMADDKTDAAAYLVLLIRRALPSLSPSADAAIRDRLEASGLDALDRKARERDALRIHKSESEKPPRAPRVRSWGGYGSYGRWDGGPPVGAHDLGKRR